MVVEPAGTERLRAVPAPEAEDEAEARYPRVRAFLRVGVYALLLLTPLPFGSVQPWAILGLEVAAAILGSVALIVLLPRRRIVSEPAGDQAPSRDLLPWIVGALVVILVAIGVVQTLPGPWGRTAAPGASARASIAAFASESAPVTAPWSLAPAETVDATARFTAYALLAFTSFVAFHRPKHIMTLAVVIVASALFQAVYGSAEYLSGRQSIFLYKKKYYVDSATGTFVNRNHFAGYLAASLPFVFVVTAWFRDLARLGRHRKLCLLAGATIACVVWIGILLSRSRAGLAVAVASICLSATLIGSKRRTAWGVASILTVGVLFVLWRDVNLPAARLATTQEDFAGHAGRLAVWRESLSVAFPGFGLGFGTFQDGFAALATTDVGALTYDHAHNDYVEAFLEGGTIVAIVGTALLLSILIAALRSTPTVQACSVALMAIALHSLVDFGLRIPSIACFCACVVGIVVGFSMPAVRTYSGRYHHAHVTSRGPTPRSVLPPA